MNNFAPTPKVAVGALAGALSVIIVWLVGQFHIIIPPEIGSAFTTVISAAASWFAPHSDPTPEQIKAITDQSPEQIQAIKNK